MSRIRSKNTKPEETVRKFLFAQGFRYRKNDSKLPGKPDIVLPKYRTVIFVNGCFWHGHEGCRYFKYPRTNEDFWRAKIHGNRLRDRVKAEALQEQGWHVIIVWECQLKGSNADHCLESLIDEIRKKTAKEQIGITD